MDMIRRTIGPDAAPAGQVSPVNSHNEWDPLEEVIVGRLEGATIPSDHPVVTCNIPGMAARAQSLVAGFRFPRPATMCSASWRICRSIGRGSAAERGCRSRRTCTAAAWNRLPRLAAFTSFPLFAKR